MNRLTPFVGRCYRLNPSRKGGFSFVFDSPAVSAVHTCTAGHQSAVLFRRVMRTYFPKKGDIEPRWFVIDAEGQVLGRLSTTIANIISGKAKPTYTPFLDTGDHVIVINAEKILLTGKKETDKIYRQHSLYPGGLK